MNSLPTSAVFHALPDLVRRSPARASARCWSRALRRPDRRAAPGDMSSAPFATTQTGCSPSSATSSGYTSNFSAPLVRFSTSAANILHNRSRKSPSFPVAPGNWWEIFRVVPACAKVRGAPSASGTLASAPATKRRRETSMNSSLDKIETPRYVGRHGLDRGLRDWIGRVLSPVDMLPGPARPRVGAQAVDPPARASPSHGLLGSR